MFLKRYNLFGINDTGAVVLQQSTIDYIAESKKNEETNPLLGE